MLTFLATKSVTSSAARKHPAAILAVRRFVDASIKTIPQKDEPRSGMPQNGNSEKRRLHNYQLFIGKLHWETTYIELKGS